MGNASSLLQGRLKEVHAFFNLFIRQRRPVNVLLVGLDHSGKTTVLHAMTQQLGEPTQPTVGAVRRRAVYQNLKLDIVDCGGSASSQGSTHHNDSFTIWQHYETVQYHAVIFVVDSTDYVRLDKHCGSKQNSRDALHKLLEDVNFSKSSVLILANKQDVSGCMHVAQVAEGLQLSMLRHRDWYIQACSAKLGEGVFEGIEWLCKRMRERLKSGND